MEWRPGHLVLILRRFVETIGEEFEIEARLPTGSAAIADHARRCLLAYQPSLALLNAKKCPAG